MPNGYSSRWTRFPFGYGRQVLFVDMAYATEWVQIISECCPQEPEQKTGVGTGIEPFGQPVPDQFMNLPEVVTGSARKDVMFEVIVFMHE